MRYNIVLGTAALLFFLLGDGARMIYTTYYMYPKYDPFILVFCFSCISLATSGLTLAWNRQQHFGTPSPSVLRAYVLINVFTLLSWASGYHAIKYIHPVSFSAIAVSVGPIMIALMRFKQLGRLNLLAAAVGSTTAISLSTAEASALTGENDRLFSLAVGATLSIACGISIYLNTILAKRLNDSGQSPVRVNALRSLFVFIICAFVCYSSDLLHTLADNMLYLTSFTLFFMFSPQIALLLAIKHLGPSFVTIGISMAPIMAMLVQTSFFGIKIASDLAFTIVVNGLSLVGMAMIQTRKGPTEG